MKLTLETDSGDEILKIEYDPESYTYTIKGRDLARQGGKNEYESNDGLHVVGLVHLYFGMLDSRNYLEYKLKEKQKNE